MVEDLKHYRVFLLWFEWSGGQNKNSIWIQGKVKQERPRVQVNPVSVINSKYAWLWESFLKGDCKVQEIDVVNTTHNYLWSLGYSKFLCKWGTQWYTWCTMSKSNLCRALVLSALFMWTVVCVWGNCEWGMDRDSRHEKWNMQLLNQLEARLHLQIQFPNRCRWYVQTRLCKQWSSTAVWSLHVKFMILDWAWYIAYCLVTFRTRMSFKRGRNFLISSSVMCWRINCSRSWMFLQLSSSRRRAMSVFTVKKGVFCSTSPPTPDTTLRCKTTKGHL